MLSKQCGWKDGLVQVELVMALIIQWMKQKQVICKDRCRSTLNWIDWKFEIIYSDIVCCGSESIFILEFRKLFSKDSWNSLTWVGDIITTCFSALHAQSISNVLGYAFHSLRSKLSVSLKYFHKCMFKWDIIDIILWRMWA